MMKFILPLCVATLIISCKKNDTANISAARILQITNKDSTGVEGTKTGFDYDQQGRITKVSYTSNSSTFVFATIVYSGSDIIITPTPTFLPASTIKDEIRYKVDAAGNPLTRIQTTTKTFGTPNPPQYEYKTDTSSYQYDGSGLLIKKTTSSFDSLWFDPNPGDIEIQIDTRKSTAIYTNTGNTLAQIDITAYDSSRYTFGKNNLNYGTKTVESDKFNYSKNYKTATDFTNSIILTEYGIVPNIYYPVNKSYSYFPDNIVTSTVSANSYTGEVTNSSQTINFRINNNKSGLTSNVDLLSANGNVSNSQLITYK